MIVVSDTSPLTYLHQIGRFGLLEALYEEVVIPPAVQRELQRAPDLHEKLDWSLLRVVAPKGLDAVTSLCRSLDRGEAEAIVVASELGADLLLIDEVDGRSAAARIGIRYTGLLGSCSMRRGGSSYRVSLRSSIVFRKPRASECIRT